MLDQIDCSEHFAAPADVVLQGVSQSESHLLYLNRLLVHLNLVLVYVAVNHELPILSHSEPLNMLRMPHYVKVFPWRLHRLQESSCEVR